MLKSCFCVFLSVALAVFLSLSALAVPPNSDYVGIYSLRSLSLSFEDITVSDSFTPNLNFGSFYAFNVQPIDGSSLPSSASIDLVFDINSDLPFDIYFFSGITIPAFNYSMDTALYISSLYSYETSTYLDPSILASKIFASNPVIVSSVDVLFVSGDYLINSDNSYLNLLDSIEVAPFADRTISLRFYGLSSISPGHYKITVSGPLNSSGAQFPLGMFIDYLESDDPILSYEEGLISFSEASAMIKDQMNEVVNNPELTDSAKQMAIAIADNKLDQLQEVSNNKFAVLVDQFDSSSTAIVNSYINSGSTNIAPALDSLNSIYSDYLTQTTSPEQGTLINTQYSVKLAQLQTVFEVNYKRELEGVISDQDMLNKEQQLEKVDSLLQIEDEALQIFDESEYQSQLVFQSWISQFSGDVTVYRSVFDFLFEDSRTSRFQPFLIIPFSLVLVGVLLSTTTVVFRRRG